MGLSGEGKQKPSKTGPSQNDQKTCFFFQIWRLWTFRRVLQVVNPEPSNDYPGRLSFIVFKRTHIELTKGFFK